MNQFANEIAQGHGFKNIPKGFGHVIPITSSDQSMVDVIATDKHVPTKTQKANPISRVKHMAMHLESSMLLSNSIQVNKTLFNEHRNSQQPSQSLQQRISRFNSIGDLTTARCQMYEDNWRNGDLRNREETFDNKDRFVSGYPRFSPLKDMLGKNEEVPQKLQRVADDGMLLECRNSNCQSADNFMSKSMSRLQVYSSDDDIASTATIADMQPARVPNQLHYARTVDADESLEDVKRPCVIIKQTIKTPPVNAEGGSICDRDDLRDYNTQTKETRSNRVCGVDRTDNIRSRIFNLGKSIDSHLMHHTAGSTCKGQASLHELEIEDAGVFISGNSINQWMGHSSWIEGGASTMQNDIAVLRPEYALKLPTSHGSLESSPRVHGAESHTPWPLHPMRKSSNDDFLDGGLCPLAKAPSPPKAPLTFDQVLLQYSKTTATNQVVHSERDVSLSPPSAASLSSQRQRTEDWQSVRWQRQGEISNSPSYERAGVFGISQCSQSCRANDVFPSPRWRCVHSSDGSNDVVGTNKETEHAASGEQLVGCLANQLGILSSARRPDQSGDMLKQSTAASNNYLVQQNDRACSSYESGYLSDGGSTCCCGKFRQFETHSSDDCYTGQLVIPGHAGFSNYLDSGTIGNERNDPLVNFNLMRALQLQQVCDQRSASVPGTSPISNHTHDYLVGNRLVQAVHEEGQSASNDRCWKEKSKWCADVRGYSSQSTGSSMNSAGSAYSAPASCNQQHHHKVNVRFQMKPSQKVIAPKDKRFVGDEAVRSNQYGSLLELNDLPSFARHTEASKRRSRFLVSTSIPENLNSQSSLVSSAQEHLSDSSTCLPTPTLGNKKASWGYGAALRRDCKNSAESGDKRSPLQPSIVQEVNQAKQLVKNRPAPIEEREPEGQYHIDKKWRESLRQYGSSSANVQWRSKSSRSHNEKHVVAETDTTQQCEEHRQRKQIGSSKPSERNPLTTPKPTGYLNGCDLRRVSLRAPPSDPPPTCHLSQQISSPASHQSIVSVSARMDQPLGSIPPLGASARQVGNLINRNFCKLDTVREENAFPCVYAEKCTPTAVLGISANSASSICRYFSEANLSKQCNALGRKATCSDILVCPEQLPLRYKRESWVKRFGVDDGGANCVQPIEEFIELEPDDDPQFERRNVVPKKARPSEKDYIFGEFLGRGKFGEVKKCTERKSQKELAAKVIPVRSENDRANVYNEIEVMNSLQHPRLLQLYEAYDCGKEIVLIMELINGGELFERVIDDDFILTEILCEVYVRQICEGIAFMHKENFLHLDMKPENILCINRDGHRIKIIDFGLARKFIPGDSLRILFGTPEFVAPEVVSYEKIGQGTDLWSIGVICYVLLSGLSPFMGENDAETYNNINHVEYDFDDEAFEEISSDAKDFISKLLILKPEDRMTADQCLAHKWLTRHSTRTSSASDNITINTRKLKRFVIRRRWQKAVNVLLALKRMGMGL